MSAGDEFPASLRARCGWLRICGHSSGGELLECGVDKRTQVPAVDEFVGRFAGGVVSAGQHLRDEVDAQLRESAQDFDGVFGEEGEVVLCVDDQHLLWLRGEALHVVDGTGGSEELAQTLLRKASVFKGLADVTGALAGPDDIAK